MRIKPGASLVSTNSAVETLAPQPADAGVGDEEFDEDVNEASFHDYIPEKLAYGKPHPDPLVESSSLAAVPPPEVVYALHIPVNAIDEAKLSNAQLETIGEKSTHTLQI
jgi:hypothetical protein